MRRRPTAALVLALAGASYAVPAASFDGRRVADALAPQGPVAARIAETWWLLFWAASIVFVVVGALFLVALFRRGRAATDGTRPSDARTHPYLIGGTVLTALVLTGTAILTFTVMRDLDAPAAPPRHTFEIVGKRWWWEIRYDGETIGANEIHVPVGEPVEFRLASDNVIHSFWVPELGGKRDLVPGHPLSLWLQADEAGVYRGVCAEFCGLQHAKMGFLVIAEPPDRFDAWLERVRAQAEEPDGGAAHGGREVFMNAGCAGCHTVRGTEARGRTGPDLTHLAGRRTLAAAQLPNTRGHLAGWIVDPQGIKPGNQMPPQDLAGEDLQALLAYLTGLE